MKEDPKQELAQLFKDARGEVSQSDFAKKLGISQSHLSKIELGTYAPSAKIVRRLAEKSRPRALKLLEEVQIAAIRSEARAT
jgi:transcriptional regulator with XRE-family HTH domain